MRVPVLVVVALAAVGAANAAVPTPDTVKTGFAGSWAWHGIRCTSRRAGLTCKNQFGHGFVLSRQSQHVF